MSSIGTGTDSKIYTKNFQASSPKMDRKTIEKNRRIQMKTLFAKLNSLVPQQKEAILLPDQLEQAAIYIKQSQTRIKKLKERKEYLLGIVKIDATMNTMAVDSQPLQIEIRHEGSALMVTLVGGLNSQCMLYKSIRAAEEEGAQVVNAGSAVVDDKIYHTIHAEVTDAKQGFQASRISERLKILVEEFIDSRRNENVAISTITDEDNTGSGKMKAVNNGTT